MWPLVFCIIFYTLSDVVLPVTFGYDRKAGCLQRLTALGRLRGARPSVIGNFLLSCHCRDSWKAFI